MLRVPLSSRIFYFSPEATLHAFWLVLLLSGTLFMRTTQIYHIFSFSKGSADFGELPAQQKSSFQEKLNFEVHSGTPWPSFWIHFGEKIVRFFGGTGFCIFTERKSGKANTSSLSGRRTSIFMNFLTSAASHLMQRSKRFLAFSALDGRKP